MIITMMMIKKMIITETVIVKIIRNELDIDACCKYIIKIINSINQLNRFRLITFPQCDSA